MPPSGSRLDSPRLLSFHDWCLTCGEGPMGKRWWVGRISSLPVFLSLWFWLWLDWWSATFQGTSYQAQRDLERMMMSFFTEQPALCQLPVMAQRPVSETPAQGCTWTVMGRLKLAYERWTENLASPFWRRRGPAARWCREPLEGDKSLKAVVHEEGCGPWGRLLAELSCFPEMDVRSRELNHPNSPWATEPETNCHRGLLNLYFIL